MQPLGLCRHLEHPNFVLGGAGSSTLTTRLGGAGSSTPASRRAAFFARARGGPVLSCGPSMTFSHSLATSSLLGAFRFLPLPRLGSGRDPAAPTEGASMRSADLGFRTWSQVAKPRRQGAGPGAPRKQTPRAPAHKQRTCLEGRLFVTDFDATSISSREGPRRKFPYAAACRLDTHNREREREEAKKREAVGCASMTACLYCSITYYYQQGHKNPVV